MRAQATIAGIDIPDSATAEQEEAIVQGRLDRIEGEVNALAEKLDLPEQPHDPASQVAILNDPASSDSQKTLAALHLIDNILF